MRFPHVLASVLFASACATANSPGADRASLASEPAVAESFSPLQGGGYWHPASKGQCPPELAGFDFVKTEIFNNDPNNVGCQYAGPGYLTVYFFVFDGLPDARASALDAVNAITSRFSDAEPLKEESEACSMTADLRQGLADALTSGLTSDVEIVIGKTQCYVFRIPQGVTLVATDKVGPWHLKLRLTIPTEDGDGSNIADLAATALNFERSVMAGKPMPFQDELLKPGTN